MTKVGFRLVGLGIFQEADAYFSVGEDGGISGTLEGDIGSLFFGNPCRVAQNIRIGFFFFFLHKIKSTYTFSSSFFSTGFYSTFDSSFPFEIREGILLVEPGTSNSI